jgi:hypothetical protein
LGPVSEAEAADPGKVWAERFARSINYHCWLPGCPS